MPHCSSRSWSTQAGADARGDVTAAEGNAPLHAAAMQGHIPALKALLAEAGVAIHARNAAGETALHLAAKHGQPDAVSWLLRRGASPQERDSRGWTPAHAAAVAGHAAVLPLLPKPSLCLPDGSGATPLHHAAAQGQVASLLELIRLGCAVAPVDHSGYTPLLAAAFTGNVDAIRALSSVRLCSATARL
jgi:ankyrin repeat protein